MIKIFKTFGGYTEITEIEKNCWINVTAPNQTEIQRIIDEFKLLILSLKFLPKMLILGKYLEL